MRNFDKAISSAQRLVRKYKTRDPFVIAELLGIKIIFQPNFKNQKGAFTVLMGVPFIFINPHLSDHMQRIVCAHEIGHALLHRSLAKADSPLMEFEIMDMQTACEYEANVFASNFLLDEDEISEYLEQGCDVVFIARAMNTNINLLLMKLQSQSSKSKKSLSLPEMPHGNFLGKIKDDAGEL